MHINVPGTRIFSISLFFKAAGVTREDEISKSNHSDASDKSGYSRESHSRSRYTGRPGKDLGQSGPVVIKHDLKLTLSYSYSKFWYVLYFNRKVLVFTLILINFRLRKEERYKVGALS